MDLADAGVYRYAEDVSTDIWCMAWAFDDEEPQIWTPEFHELHHGDCTLPARVMRHILHGGEVRAWNAQFERVIWKAIMTRKYAAPNVQDSQFVCTAAEAAAMALPRSLDYAAKALGLTEEKDQKGYELMLRMSRPRSTDENGTPVWWDVDERKDRLFEYCKQDVRVERAAKACLRRLTPHERDVYLMDQRINDRGICIDRPLVTAAQNIAFRATQQANTVVRSLSGGAVREITNINEMQAWLQANGIYTPSIDKNHVRALLDGELPEDVRLALEARAEAGRSSVAKLGSMLSVACSDDRARGLMLYHGASTGRWTGKLIQPHNFPRGDVKHVESYIPAVLEGDFDTINILATPTSVISSMLRSMLTAGPGNDLIGADFSAIEARVLNWLAGQEDMLETFRAFDAGDETKDPYIVNAMGLYNIPFEHVLKFPHRQTGKFQELACGFQMGARKAKTAAKDVYGLEITEAQAKVIVKNYRDTHPAVVEYWANCEAAFLGAVAEPGDVKRVGVVKFVKLGGYLYVILPSGRPLCYASPRIVERATPWGEMKDAVEFSCVNGYTRKWERDAAYGGLIVENIVQAVSRDLLADAMLRIEAKGYPPVLSVHDEIVAEVPKEFGSIDEFEQLMTEVPAWATGCPIAVEGWRGERYRK